MQLEIGLFLRFSCVLQYQPQVVQEYCLFSYVLIWLEMTISTPYCIWLEMTISIPYNINFRSDI